MRRKITTLLATAALVLFGAGTASAISVTMTSDYDGVSVLPVGALVNIELFLDADVTGIQLLSVGVAFDNAIFQYNPQSLAATGVPSYILYGSVGMAMTWLQAQQDPWQTWPGTVLPGTAQVNVNWADASFVGTGVTGLGIKIAGIQLQVIAEGDGLGDVILSSTLGGNVLQVGGVVVPLPTVGTFAVNTAVIPEPTTAVLVGLGLAGLGIAGRRRSA